MAFRVLDYKLDFDSYACVPVWHLEHGIQSWLCLIADRLYLDGYASRNCYGVRVYYIPVQVQSYLQKIRLQRRP